MESGLTALWSQGMLNNDTETRAIQMLPPDLLQKIARDPEMHLSGCNFPALEPQTVFIHLNTSALQFYEKHQSSLQPCNTTKSHTKIKTDNQLTKPENACLRKPCSTEEFTANL